MPPVVTPTPDEPSPTAPADPTKVQACFNKLSQNPVFKCLAGLANGDRPNYPSRDDIVACGCKFGGTGRGTKVGKRDTFACPGQPPFYVSPLPPAGVPMGIGVGDGDNFPDCFFDLAPGDDSPVAGPVLKPALGNNCFASGCHDRQDPFIGGGTYLPPPDSINQWVNPSPIQINTPTPAPNL